MHPELVAQVRSSLQDDSVYERLAATFAALGDPNRAKIVASLAAHELCVGDLASLLGVSESSVSQHLRILRNLRWVRHRKQGRLVYYTLDDDHVRALMDLGLAHALGA